MICSENMNAELPTKRWCSYVPRPVSNEDVQALRALLADYTEAEIRQALSVETVEVNLTPFADGLAGDSIASPLHSLVRLFHGLYTNAAELPAVTLSLLDRLGLIAYDEDFPSLIYATVAIFRVAGELTVCDRGGSPDGSDYPAAPDIVYPPVFENTLQYLASLPSTPCEAMLEIGTGSGIAALLGARHAKHVWATDITARAVHFSLLNCRLAGLDNITVREGDLYHPVDGLTFDRIAIHPPWAPAAQSQFAYANGGEDGETVISGAVEGLPRFLRPGGRFHATLLSSDRNGERFEQRVRRWLGTAENQFDIAVAVLSCDSPQGFLAQNLTRGSICEADIPMWTQLLETNRTETVLYAHLIVQRHKGEREPATVRVQTAVESNAPYLEGLLAAE